MAKQPRPLPRWSGTIYGGDEDAWEEAKAQCRRTLRVWAVRRYYGTYSDLVREVTTIHWSDGPLTHAGNQVAYLLGQLALEELDPKDDRPVISALVVEKERGRPAGGFWNLRRDLGLADAISTDGRRERFWLDEIQRCWKVYGARSDGM